MPLTPIRSVLLALALPRAALAISSMTFEYGHDKSARDGWSPTLVAAKNGHSEELHHLIAAKADVDKPMQDGSSPTFMAALNGHSGALQLRERDINSHTWQVWERSWQSRACRPRRAPRYASQSAAGAPRVRAARRRWANAH